MSLFFYQNNSSSVHVAPSRSFEVTNAPNELYCVALRCFFLIFVGHLAAREGTRLARQLAAQRVGRNTGERRRSRSHQGHDAELVPRVIHCCIFTFRTTKYINVCMCVCTAISLEIRYDRLHPGGSVLTKLDVYPHTARRPKRVVSAEKGGEGKISCRRKAVQKLLLSFCTDTFSATESSRAQKNRFRRGRGGGGLTPERFR